jgi:hypothetical protein
MTLLTVAMETPARAATSLIVRARGMSDLRIFVILFIAIVT